MTNLLRQPLYQVFAETSDGELMAVSPKLVRSAAEQVSIAVKDAIRQGKRDWGNVHVALATTFH